MIDFHIISSALQSVDEEIRRSALLPLCGISSPEAQAILFSAMGDSSWRVRKEAVECYLRSNPDLDSVERLLQLLRNEDNAGLRNSAAEAVIRLGATCALPLIKMVKDQDADVRKFIIDVMGAIGDPLFVPALLPVLNDSDVNVASAAAEQLGVLGDGEAAEPLMKAILTRDDVLFRFSALGALGVLAKPTKIPEDLLKLAEQDIFKKAVFECLGAVSDESSLEMLLSGASSRQRNCRAVAVKALYRIFRRSSTAAQKRITDILHLHTDDGFITGLLELYDKQDTLLVESLLWIAVAIRGARFIPLLFEAYSNELTTDAAFAALKSFGPEVSSEIISRYANLTEKGRSGLCTLIADCRFSDCSVVIREALHDPSAHVRTSAAIAAGKLGLKAMIPELVLLLDDRESLVYMAAVTGLQSLVAVDRAAIHAEVDYLCSSRKPSHRKAAALLLESLGEFDRLLLFIKDEEPQVRKAAISALGSQARNASGELLVSALADEDPDVRITVADALGNLHDGATLDALEHALTDEDVWVQSAVLKAIARIEPARALAIIMNIGREAKGLLMITSLQVLEEIGGSVAENIIREALECGDQDIARQASRSLERVLVNNSNQGVHDVPFTARS